MTIKPLFDKVVLKKAEKETKSKSGIILTTSAQETPEYFEVLAVGEGLVVDGTLQDMQVAVGNKVLINKFSGTEIKLNDVEYTIVSQTEILAIID